MNTEILESAKNHMRGNPSALHCLTQAVEHEIEGRGELAGKWALRSLGHSVGILHPDYTRAFRALFGKNSPVTLI